MLYVTVSLAPTGWREYNVDSRVGYVSSQYLHAQPAIPSYATPTYPVFDYADPGLSLQQYPYQWAQYVNQLGPNSDGTGNGKWSCFTYRVDLTKVCDPAQATSYKVGSNATNPGGCACKLAAGCAAPIYRDISV